MNEQLAGGFRNVQVVFKEFLDGEQRLVVEAVDRALLKDLLEEHLAQGGRQLVDQASDAEVVVADNRLFGVEHLADLQRNLGFLEGLGQLLDAGNDGADADDDAGVELAAQRVHNRAGQLFDILAVDAALDLLDQDNVLLADVEDKVLLLVREEVLDDVEGGDIVGRDDTDEQDDAVDVGVKVQFARLDIDIARQNVFQNDVFDEVVAVILFVVVLLDAGEGDGQNVAELGCDLVGSLHKDRVIRLGPGAERLVGVAVADKNIGVLVEVQHQIFVGFADSGQVAAGDGNRVAVHYADDTVDGVPHLMNDPLK